jgi:hypothetical protein
MADLQVPTSEPPRESKVMIAEVGPEAVNTDPFNLTPPILIDSK